MKPAVKNETAQPSQPPTNASAAAPLSACADRPSVLCATTATPSWQRCSMKPSTAIPPVASSSSRSSSQLNRRCLPNCASPNRRLHLRPPRSQNRPSRNAVSPPNGRTSPNSFPPRNPIANLLKPGARSSTKGKRSAYLPCANGRMQPAPGLASPRRRIASLAHGSPRKLRRR